MGRSMKCLAAMFALTLMAAPAVKGQNGASAEILFGSAWNVPLPLALSGASASARFRARYSTRPFTGSPYYAGRVGYSDDGRGVELELIHHKLFLENPAPPVERLEITHGYNLPMINGVGPAGGWQFRIGVGLVIAHAEGRIAGHDIDSGYRVAGAALQIALGRRYALTSGEPLLTATPEVKVTGSFARMRLTPGTLFVPNIALHALAGLGVQSGAR
jgi:hypothetical protein